MAKLPPRSLVKPHVSDVPDWLPRRQKIWEVGCGLQCSLIGTCLSQEDLLRTARKCGVRLVPHLAVYPEMPNNVSRLGGLRSTGVTA